MKRPAKAGHDFELAIRAARLWPNRKHEASAVFGLLCRCGLHRWRRLNLTDIMPSKNILHCFWCSQVMIDGIAYDV